MGNKNSRPNKNHGPSDGKGGGVLTKPSAPIDIPKSGRNNDKRPPASPDGGYGGAVHVRHSAPIDIPKKE